MDARRLDGAVAIVDWVEAAMQHTGFLTTCKRPSMIPGRADTMLLWECSAVPARRNTLLSLESCRADPPDY